MDQVRIITTTLNFVDFFVNSSTCLCDCKPDPCPNADLLPGCICGDCHDNWGPDADGYCTVCLLNETSCLATEVLDTEHCVCLCANLTCNIDLGQVPNLPDTCSCRPCEAGECSKLVIQRILIKQNVEMGLLNLGRNVIQLFQIRVACNANSPTMFVMTAIPAQQMTDVMELAIVKEITNAPLPPNVWILAAIHVCAFLL